MQTVTLDFSNCKYIHDIHTIIKNAFTFPDFYGENLDALWDCGRDYIAFSGEKMQIRIVGISNLSRDLQEYMLKILDVFNDLREADPDISFKIL